MARLRAEKEDAQADAAVLRRELTACLERVAAAESEAGALRRDATAHRDPLDELDEAKSELVLRDKAINP